MVAIQSLETVTKQLDQEIEDGKVHSLVEAEQLLVCYEVAAMDLRSYYEKISPQFGDMPSYDELIEQAS